MTAPYKRANNRPESKPRRPESTKTASNMLNYLEEQ
jgi:hypothetical protein